MESICVRVEKFHGIFILKKTKFLVIDVGFGKLLEKKKRKEKKRKEKKGYLRLNHVPQTGVTGQ
jgi:hypothetical protein